MENMRPVSHGDLIVCACQGREYTARDAMEAALFRDGLATTWPAFLGQVAASDRADELDLQLDEDALGTVAETFRYQHDLITAEETEQWLSARRLTLDEFGDYFVRGVWGEKQIEGVRPEKVDYVSARTELRETFIADLILSGKLEAMTTQLGWRLAAVCSAKDVDLDLVTAAKQNFLERNEMNPARLRDWLQQLCRDEEWLDQQAMMEAAYQSRCATLLVGQAQQRELASLRLPLTQFETEVIELESRDAAQEALFCVREDGMSMQEVANEGRYPYRRLDFVLEDLGDEMQQRFFSVSNGQVLEPLPRGDGFELCRVIRKIEPQASDPITRSRIEQRLLNRHFSELASKYVDMRLQVAGVAE
jgi:hypothetical protein